MYYAIISQDVENSLDKRLSARPDHVCRLQELQDEGRLLIAGPHPHIDSEDPGPAGFSGSLIVAEFDSLQSQHRHGQMPTLTSPPGYMKTSSLKPFQESVSQWLNLIAQK